MESADFGYTRCQNRIGNWPKSRGHDRTTATHLSCLRICPVALACDRTSFRNELTSSTINFFIPSIESSSSNEKSNFCFTSDQRGEMEVRRKRENQTSAQTRNGKQCTASQTGSSAGSCHTCRYGWFSACSQLIRLAGSKHSI